MSVLLHPKLIATIAGVLVLFLLISLVSEMNRRLQIQREVSSLQQEVTAMEKQVIELQNLNQYFRTDDYQERLAREKLNYQAPGERVVLIPEGATFTDSTPTAPQADEATASMPLRWWNAFFSPE